MKVLTQSRNVLYEIEKAYIIESIDDFDNSTFYIEGVDRHREKIKLGTYRTKNDAQYILEQICKNENYQLPPTDFNDYFEIEQCKTIYEEDEDDDEY